MDTEGHVTDRLYNAYYYIRSRKSGITSTEKQLMEFAQKSLAKALEATNQFYSDKWPDYQAMIQAMEFKRFKSFQTFDMKE